MADVPESYFSYSSNFDRYFNLRSQFLKYGLKTVLMECALNPDVFGVLRVPIKQDRREVSGYMFSEESRKNFEMLGYLFADLAKSSDNFVFPETNEEVACLAKRVLYAKSTGEPMTFYTPLCPDWSMDDQGRYNFESLGGRESFIAKKYFRYSPELLKVFKKHEIPYRGELIFADWGMETEIMDKNTFGVKLSQEDIRMCFDSSYSAVDEHLKRLQASDDGLYRDFRVTLMTDFFDRSGLDLEEADRQFRQYFRSDNRGKRLLRQLSEESYPVNKSRMGVSREVSDAECLENLIDYAIFGQALNSHGLIIACESRITSRAYNLPREDDQKVPMFFVKGVKKDSGVNIL